MAYVFLIEDTFFYLLMSEWSKHCLALKRAVARYGGGITQFHWFIFNYLPFVTSGCNFFSCAGEFQQINEVVVLSVVYYYQECLITKQNSLIDLPKLVKCCIASAIFFGTTNKGGRLGQFCKWCKLHLSDRFPINLR